MFPLVYLTKVSTAALSMYFSKSIPTSVALSGQQTLVELHASRTNEDVRMYTEEFILVGIWIHCCASWN